MGHNHVVSGNPKSIGIPQVEGLSTGPPNLGCHKVKGFCCHPHNLLSFCFFLFLFV